MDSPPAKLADIQRDIQQTETAVMGQLHTLLNSRQQQQLQQEMSSAAAELMQQLRYKAGLILQLECRQEQAEGAEQSPVAPDVQLQLQALGATVQTHTGTLQQVFGEAMLQDLQAVLESMYTQEARLRLQHGPEALQPDTPLSAELSSGAGLHQYQLQQQSQAEALQPGLIGAQQEVAAEHAQQQQHGTAGAEQAPLAASQTSALLIEQQSDVSDTGRGGLSAALISDFDASANAGSVSAQQTANQEYPAPPAGEHSMGLLPMQLDFDSADGSPSSSRAVASIHDDGGVLLNFDSRAGDSLSRSTPAASTDDDVCEAMDAGSDPNISPGPQPEGAAEAPGTHNVSRSATTAHPDGYRPSDGISQSGMSNTHEQREAGDPATGSLPEQQPALAAARPTLQADEVPVQPEADQQAQSPTPIDLQSPACDMLPIEAGDTQGQKSGSAHEARSKQVPAAATGVSAQCDWSIHGNSSPAASASAADAPSVPGSNRTTRQPAVASMSGSASAVASAPDAEPPSGADAITMHNSVSAMISAPGEAASEPGGHHTPLPPVQPPAHTGSLSHAPVSQPDAHLLKEVQLLRALTAQQAQQLQQLPGLPRQLHESKQVVVSQRADLEALIKVAEGAETLQRTCREQAAQLDATITELTSVRQKVRDLQAEFDKLDDECLTTQLLQQQLEDQMEFQAEQHVRICELEAECAALRALPRAGTGQSTAQQDAAQQSLLPSGGDSAGEGPAQRSTAAAVQPSGANAIKEREQQVALLQMQCTAASEAQAECEKLRTANHALQAQVTYIMQQNEELRQQGAELEALRLLDEHRVASIASLKQQLAETEALHSTLAALQQQLAEAKSHSQQGAGVVQVKEEECAQQNEQMEALRRQNEQLHEKLAAAEEESALADLLGQQLQEKSRLIANLEQQVQQQHAQQKEQAQQPQHGMPAGSAAQEHGVATAAGAFHLHAASSSPGKLARENAQLRLKLASLEEELALSELLGRQLTDKSATIMALEQQLQGKAQTVERLQHQLQKPAGAAAEHPQQLPAGPKEPPAAADSPQQLQSQTGLIGKLNRQIVELQQALAQAQSEARSGQAAMSQLQKQLCEALAQSQSDAQTAQATISQLQEALVQSQAQEQSIQAVNSQLQQQLHEAQQALASTQPPANARTPGTSLRSSQDAATDSLAALKQSYAELQGQLADMRGKENTAPLHHASGPHSHKQPAQKAENAAQQHHTIVPGSHDQASHTADHAALVNHKALVSHSSPAISKAVILSRSPGGGGGSDASLLLRVPLQLMQRGVGTLADANAMLEEFRVQVSSELQQLSQHCQTASHGPVAPGATPSTAASIRPSQSPIGASATATGAKPAAAATPGAAAAGGAQTPATGKAGNAQTPLQSVSFSFHTPAPAPSHLALTPQSVQGGGRQARQPAQHAHRGQQAQHGQQLVVSYMGSGELPEDRALVQILADAKEQRARAEAALLYGGYARTVRLADQSLVLFQDPADHDDASASSSDDFNMDQSFRQADPAASGNTAALHAEQAAVAELYARLAAAEQDKAALLRQLAELQHQLSTRPAAEPAWDRGTAAFGAAPTGMTAGALILSLPDCDRDDSLRFDPGQLRRALSADLTGLAAVQHAQHPQHAPQPSAAPDAGADGQASSAGAAGLGNSPVLKRSLSHPVMGAHLPLHTQQQQSLQSQHAHHIGNPPAARTLTLAVVTPDDSLDAMALELASYNLQSDLCPPLPQAPAGSAMLVADGLVSLTAAPGVVDQSPAEGVVPAMVGHEPGMHAAIGALQRQPAREGKTELEMAVADPDRRLMQAQQAAEGYREQLHGTQHQLADMQRHHQAALQQLRGRQMDLTRSEVDLVEAKQKLRQLEAQVPAPSGALRISGFEDLIEEASSELERVEGQLREASQQLLDLRSHNATLADEVDQAAHAKQKAEEEADQASQALQDILVEVTAAKHEQQRLQAAAAKLREGISSEEQAAERLSRSVAEQEAALRQVEAGIQKAKHRQVEQEQQNIRLEQERSVAVDAAKRAAHELEVVRVDLNTSQSQLAEQRAQQAEVAAQLAHLRQQAEQAQEKLADLQYAAQETATVKTAAKREAVAASEQLQQIKQQVEAVSRQLADIEKELHASRAEVADAAAQRDEHEKAAKRLHAEHVNAVSMLEQAKQALQEAIQQREHQDQATAAAKQEAVATSHAHEEAVQALEQLKAEHSQLSDVAAKLRQELAASGNESWHPRQPLMPMQPGSVQGSLRASDLPSTRWPSPQHANAGVKVAGQQALVQQLQQEVDGLQAALLAEQSKRRQTERMVLHIDQQSVSDADPEAMTMQCGKLRAQLAASEAEQAHLQEMLRELRDRNMRQGAEIGRLKQRLAQANLTPDISPRALSPHSTAQHSMGLASQYRATWQEMDRRQEDLQSCRQQVQEQRLLLDSLQSESRALQQHNEQRQMQLEVLHQEYLSLQARIATEAQLLTPLPTQPRQHQTIRSPRRSHPRDENPAAQEAAHLAAALRKAEQRAAERERDMAVLQARLDALHKDKLMLQQQRDELNSQVNVLARESHQASLDCKQLQQQLGRQASELAGLEARLGQAQYANSELKQQNQRLQSATAEESDNIQRLRCELAEQVNECQRLRERCKAAEAAAAQAQQELSAQQATANTLFQRLQHAEALASDRQDHTSSLGGRLEALESAKAAADILAEESRQQLQLLRSQLERAEAGQRQAAEAASLLREQLQAAEADATRADEPHHRAAAAVRALEEEVALLSRRLQSAEQRERQRGQHTQIATRDEAHELAGQLEQLEDAEINLTCVQLEAEEYKLLASRYQESYRVSEQRVKGLQAELEHVTAKLKSASRRISDSAVAAHAEDVKARPRASRDAAPAAHAEDAKAAEFERLRVEAEKKLAQAELATLRRQVAEHRDELRLAQKQLKQVKAELQHAEAAALQLQHVQQELAALEQDLQTKAAQRAAAVVTSRPDHAAHAMRHERTQTAELTDAKAVQLEAANKSLHDALGRLAAALQDAVRLVRRHGQSLRSKAERQQHHQQQQTATTDAHSARPHQHDSGRSAHMPHQQATNRTAPQQQQQLSEPQRQAAASQSNGQAQQPPGSQQPTPQVPDADSLALQCVTHLEVVDEILTALHSSTVSASRMAALSGDTHSSAVSASQMAALSGGAHPRVVA